jgi:hypothetical protein
MTRDGGLSLTLEGALHRLCDGDVEDVLQPWCSCVGSERGPSVMPSGGREAEASFSTQRREELSGGVLNHGPPRGLMPRCELSP